MDQSGPVSALSERLVWLCDDDKAPMIVSRRHEEIDLEKGYGFMGACFWEFPHWLPRSR
jgi:hypothetical protein